MKMQRSTRRSVARILLTGFLVLSAAVFVSGQVGSETSKKGGKGAPAPLSTTPYDVWTMEQLTKPGNLGNYGNHACSVQRRDVGAAPESHDNFAHVLIFTSGSGNVNIGGEIIDGPDGKKIVRGGDRRKIVVGEVYHIPVKVAHWVIPDAGSSVTYFVCNLYTTTP
jgi:mannose-6-phosphate isomerase-like protein (cupin superfamily)